LGAVALSVLAILGCDSRESDSTSVPARAERSVAELSPREQAAAQPLVRLESAARDRDAEELCHSVYAFAGGTSPGCEDTVKRLFPTEDGYSLRVRSIRFLGRARAVARTTVVVINADGRKSASPNSTFRLARRAGVWHVVFIT
jgi:hypothetical protein